MSTYQYRSNAGRLYHIENDAPPIPTRAHDWRWMADDFDGSPDSGDARCGTAGKYWVCVDQIEECENDAR